MAAQVTQDLRTLVARRVGLRQRVVLLGRDESLVAALRDNQCEVLVDPPSLERMTEGRPQVVVAFDGALGQGGLVLSQALGAAHGARLVLSFANSASATGVLRALTGQALQPSAHERDVRALLARAGYRIAARDVVLERTPPSTLAPETEAALRQLFEQLNPAAGVERLLVVAEPGAEATAIDRSVGLLSVVVSDGPRPSLRGTLKSLARQLYQPVEVIVASPKADGEMLAVLKGRLGYRVEAIGDAAAGSAGWNRGAAQAQGQYLSYLSAGDLVEPNHFGQLIARLNESTHAWALAPVAGHPPGPFQLAAWVRASAVDPARWVVDVTRLGAFALRFADEGPEPELALFVRLAALFAPTVLTGEPTLSLERPLHTQLDSLAPMLHGRPLQSLLSLARLLVLEPKASLGALLVERAAALDPRFGRILSRVQRAAKAARLQARQG